MCIFTGPVRDVSSTRIFARLSGRGTQYLAYQMTFSADQDLAMVLPLPVSSREEDAVLFLAPESCRRIFERLETAMPGSAETAAAGPAEQALGVHAVGDYEASFVPSVRDFGRLDERFRLPARLWDDLSWYGSYGFAVFKLSPGSAAGRGTAVHPMALEFPTALHHQLFFPTVHLHDGHVHDEEEFDHRLYWQGRATGTPSDFDRVQRSEETLGRHMDVELTQGLVDSERIGYRASLQGLRPNDDLILHVEAPRWTPREPAPVLDW